MQHYEIVCIIHPNQNKRIPEIIKRYKNIIINNKGKVHRLENWGKRQLSYKIKNLLKAFYICLNIEVNLETLKKIENMLKFNDSILRFLIIKIKGIHSEKSLIIKNLEKTLLKKKRKKNIKI